MLNHSQFFPRPLHMLGSPRKRKTFTRALQHLRTALSVGSLFSNQNSDNLLNSIQIQNPQTHIKQAPIRLDDCHTCILLYELLFSYSLQMKQK